MPQATIDISATSQELLRELADKTGQSISEVLDKALVAYRRGIFFDKLNAGYAELRADPTAWEKHESDRKKWDGTLMDGLSADERWTEDRRCLPNESQSGER